MNWVLFYSAGRQESFSVLKEVIVLCVRLYGRDFCLINGENAAWICLFVTTCCTIYICVTPSEQNFCYQPNRNLGVCMVRSLSTTNDCCL